MRALLLFLVVAAAFLAVRWFTQEPVAVAEDGGGSAKGARFLTPPPQLPVSDSPTAQSVPAAVVEQENPAEQAETRVGDRPAEDVWPANLVKVPTGSTDEVRVAAALVHGTPIEVQSAAAALEPDRALLLESFSWAVNGELQQAIDLSGRLSKDALKGRELALFEAALKGETVGLHGEGGSVTLAMAMRLRAREAELALAERRFSEAARAYSELLVQELDAPWAADSRVLGAWTEGLDKAQREHRWNPRGAWPSVDVKVQSGDSLIKIRGQYLTEHPEELVCTGLIERCNRLKGYIQPDQVLRIPTDRPRVHVDLEARWALFFMGDEVAAAWPVGIGRPGEETPPGDYTVRNKLENPPWMKEGQEPIPFGDARNPLGTRWLGWSQDGVRTSYGFHGTWEPDSIGEAASDGCVRFLNEDVEVLFQILPEGTSIRIQG